MQTSDINLRQFLPDGPDAWRRRQRADFLAAVRAIALSRGGVDAVDRVSGRVQSLVKASVVGGTLASSEDLEAWRSVSGAFIAGLPSVFDRLRPQMMPFAPLSRLALLSRSFIGTEVGAGDAIPAAAFSLNAGTLTPRGVAALVVLSTDLLARAPGAADLLDRALGEAISAAADKLFLTALAAVNLPIASAGNSIDDVDALLAGVTASGSGAGLAFVFSADLVKQLATLRTSSGGDLMWPGVTVGGGSIAGTPVYPSDQIDAGVGMLVDASQLAGDPGELQIAASRSADVEMDAAPGGSINTGSPPAPSAASVVSMFQTNSTAIRATRSLSFEVLASGAVATISGADYGGSP